MSDQSPRPFTVLMKRIKGELKLQRCNFPNLCDTYAGYVLKRNWVPPDDTIRGIHTGLAALRMPSRYQLPTVDQLLDAAKRQLTSYPGDALRPPSRPKVESDRSGVRTQPKPLGDAAVYSAPGREVAERIAYDRKYRGWVPDAESLARIAEVLGKRYGVRDKLFKCGAIALPVMTLWSTTSYVHPDTILVKPLARDRTSYSIPEEEKTFLQRQDQEQAAVRSDEGLDYRMIKIRFYRGMPQIIGATGGWYDHVLSQMSLRWELARAVLEGASLEGPDSLPRRAQYEESQPNKSLHHATRRCAAMATNTLLVIKTEASMKYLFPKRSSKVLQFPNMFDVCPGAMFECASQSETEVEWSIQHNIVREFLEEVLGDEEETKPKRLMAGQMTEKSPAVQLKKLLASGAATLSMIGISIDLTTLIPALMTILVVGESDLKALQPNLNWEFERKDALRPLTSKTASDFLSKEAVNIVPDAAVTLSLGIQWLQKQRLL